MGALRSAQMCMLDQGVGLTGRETPQARPRAALDRTNTYGTFCSMVVFRDQGLQLVFSRSCWPHVSSCTHLVFCQQGEV